MGDGHKKEYCLDLLLSAAMLIGIWIGMGIGVICSHSIEVALGLR